MSRGRRVRGILIFALALGARRATAAEAEVTVRCPELSAEDAAQVEARVRASLLGVGPEPATVELSCDVGSAQTQITGNGRQVMLRTDRNTSAVKEALLASADSALSAWGVQGSSVAEAPPPAPSLQPRALSPTVAAEPAPTPAAAPSAPPNHAPGTRPAVRSGAAKTWLATGLRAESWRHGSGLGGQLGLQHELGSAFVAVQVGYLVAVPSSTRFSARELPFGAQIGWQPPGLFGLRVALGVGLSVFGATPAAGLSAKNGNNSTLPFLGIELSRPVELGQFALLPALGASAFGATRSVEVDDNVVLALPAVAFQTSLALALKVGG